ncbi:MAG: glycogen synthase [Solirubrobacteraceae bacterium]|nr:glycogen synthase [Solirubrobacteraceae bacterium]
MRVLTVGNMYPPHHLGGYELLWQAAVRALRGRGHEVRVLVSDHREPGSGAPEEDADVHRDLRWYWHAHDFPPLSAAGRLALERHNRRVWDRHVEQFRPDALSWWAMGGMSLSLIERARRAGLPGSGWVIDDWLVYGPEVDQWIAACARHPRLARAAGRLLRQSTAVDLDAPARWVFCAEGVRASALARRPELSDTAVEPLGVAPVFGERPDREWSGRLLYAGRIDERKGIGVAIEALARLGGMSLRVVGGGDAAEAARLRALAQRLGVAVEFDAPVPRDALPAVYADADAVVFPVTWFEPFGLVPLEAMAVGRPVLATGRGGSGDYLRDGENALLHEAGDAAALAATVERLAGDPALRGRLRAGGLATARRLTEARWLGAVVREHERLAA